MVILQETQRRAGGIVGPDLAPRADIGQHGRERQARRSQPAQQRVIHRLVPVLVSKEDPTRRWQAGCVALA